MQKAPLIKELLSLFIKFKREITSPRSIHTELELDGGWYFFLQLLLYQLPIAKTDT